MTASIYSFSHRSAVAAGLFAAAVCSNAPAATTCLASPLDLSVSAVSVAPGPAVTGGPVIFTASLNNDSAKTLPWILGLYYVSTDPVVNEQDTAVGNFFESNVTPGEHRSMHSTLWLPNLAPGTYYVSGLVDFNNYIVEDDETNNWTPPIQITVVAKP